MAANPDRKKLREVTMRFKIKSEELGRLKEEVKALAAERKALKEEVDAEKATA